MGLRRRENTRMEKETSSLVSLGIVLVAIAVVITLGFGIFAVGKRLANSGQNDLVAQVDQVSTSTFTDLDQQVITGTRLKSVINQLSSGNYAVLVTTTAFLNNQAGEGTLSGDLATNKNPDTYFTVKTDYPTKSAKGTAIANTYLVNYGALLGEATAATSDGKNAQFSDTNGTIKFKDGFFTTEKELQTNAAGVVSRCDQKGDITRQGASMYAADAAQYNSFCVKDISGNYTGLAFIQLKR